jgi:hypothetical protein
MVDKIVEIDGEVYYKKARVHIEDEYIRIHPGVHWMIDLSRWYAELLSAVGLVVHTRTGDNKYDHDELPVIVSIVDDTLTISVYRVGFEDATTRLHNFMIIHLPKHIEEDFKKRIPVISDVKLEDKLIMPERMAMVVHLYFDLKKLRFVGKKQPNLDKFFDPEPEPGE